MYLALNFLFLNTSIEKDNPASGGERGKKKENTKGEVFPQSGFYPPASSPGWGKKWPRSHRFRAQNRKATSCGFLAQEEGREEGWRK